MLHHTVENEKFVPMEDEYVKLKIERIFLAFLNVQWSDNKFPGKSG